MQFWLAQEKYPQHLLLGWICRFNARCDFFSSMMHPLPQINILITKSVSGIISVTVQSNAVPKWEEQHCAQRTKYSVVWATHVIAFSSYWVCWSWAGEGRAMGPQSPCETARALMWALGRPASALQLSLLPAVLSRGPVCLAISGFASSIWKQNKSK